MYTNLEYLESANLANMEYLQIWKILNLRQCKIYEIFVNLENLEIYDERENRFSQI